MRETVAPGQATGGDIAGVPAAPGTEGPVRSMLERARTGLGSRAVRGSLRDVVLPILAIRAGLMIFGWLAVAIFAPDMLAKSWGMWNEWDGPNFLQLAAGGYGPPTDPARIVLFPLYPATISLGSLVMAPLLAAMLSSLLATIAAGLGLYELVRLDSPAGVARASVLAMVLFPTAYALVAPYSEALFLATSIWAFVAVRRDQLALAGVLGAMAGATRIQGAFLIPALGVEYLMTRGRIDRDVFWIFFIATGPLLYLGINWLTFGDPLYFLQVQKDVFFVQNQLPWVTVGNLWNGVVGATRDERWVTIFITPLASLALVAVVTVWATFSKRSRPSYAVYAAISLVSFATLSWPISVPRYILGVFPIFVAMGSWSRSTAGQSILVASTLLLGMFATLFLMGHWAF